MNSKDIIKKLKSLSNPDSVKGMASVGISPAHTYGVKIPDLRTLAKKIGKDHDLALQLWEKNNRETRILASMIDDPKQVTEVQMDEWAAEFDYWEICDQVCMNLFEKTGFAYKKAIEWSTCREEYVKRAGFVMMARLAVSDKKAADDKFEAFFQLIRRESTDERNTVKKAINWAIRQIGKRNLALNKKAVKLCSEIKRIDSKSAKWIASDALRELTSEAVQKRLSKR
ncbi:MAG: DNA alkylation repair protein [bacterium]